jgi:hypothetical protein
MGLIVRWTIGPCNRLGLTCLKRSIKSWIKTFGRPSNGIFVCHNGIKTKELDILRDLDVDLIEQSKYKSSLKIPPFDSAWKFYPPRISKDDHEVFIDNDLIVYSKFSELDNFLSRKDAAIVTAAHKPFFGNFQNRIPKEQDAINTGFFGLPPEFDFGSELNNTIGNQRWETHSDDQGAFCLAVKKLDLIVVPLKVIWVANPNVGFAPYKEGSSGTHFAGSNHGNFSYLKSFLKKTTNKILV